jgi:hypothetical protein
MLGSGQGLGVLEQAMRAALSAAGAALLEAVLAGEDGYCGPRAKCPDGHLGAYAGTRDKTITTARQYPLAGLKASELGKKLGYFERNTHRMRYARFRKPGMFTGSGAIEGGIKAIVVQRVKQSGMHWTVNGAASIIALRSQQASGRWDDFVAPTAPSPHPGLRTAI